jgi:hypothetical protein
MPEDHQTKTVSGAAAFESYWRETISSGGGGYWELVRSRSPRLNRSSLHPNDPNHEDAPDEDQED